MHSVSKPKPSGNSFVLFNCMAEYIMVSLLLLNCVHTCVLVMVLERAVWQYGILWGIKCWLTQTGRTMPFALELGSEGGAHWEEGNCCRKLAGHQAARELHCVFPCFGYSSISIIVVTVHFFRCSVKLCLSWPGSFVIVFWFSSPPQWWEGW